MTLADTLQKRIDGIEEMLSRQKTNVKHEQLHTDEGSRECLYWHYGYMIACKDILRLLGEHESKH